jgi:transcriptional regulator GlxA family with amidase domain
VAWVSHCLLKRFTDDGRVIVAAGDSAGIDMSLHVAAKLLGESLAEETAIYIEYRLHALNRSNGATKTYGRRSLGH